MNNVFAQAGIIAVLYLLLRFGEMRLILKENKPIKLLMRDTIIVFLSAVIGMYIIEEFLLQSKVIKSAPNAFIDNPTF
jgi:hypothetical protein